MSGKASATFELRLERSRGSQGECMWQKDVPSKRTSAKALKHWCCINTLMLGMCEELQGGCVAGVQRPGERVVRDEIRRVVSAAYVMPKRPPEKDFCWQHIPYFPIVATSPAGCSLLFRTLSNIVTPLIESSDVWERKTDSRVSQDFLRDTA